MAYLAKSVKIFQAGLVLLAAVASGAAATELPKNSYACQVQTKAGVAGLVLVQADSLAEAQQVSGAATAYKIAGGESPAISVIECIEAGEGRFRDGQFQSFYKNFPK